MAFHLSVFVYSVAIFILVIISFVGTTLDIVNKHRHYIVCKKNNKSLENTVTYDAMTGNIDCSFVNVDQQSRKDCSADAKVGVIICYGLFNAVIYYPFLYNYDLYANA